MASDADQTAADPRPTARAATALRVAVALLVVLVLSGLGRPAGADAAPHSIAGVAVEICHSGPAAPTGPAAPDSHDCCDTCVLCTAACLPSGPASVAAVAQDVVVIARRLAPARVGPVPRVRTPRLSQGPPVG